MKLHNISKVLGVGIAALLLTACKDGNDWSVDSSKARVFSVSSTDISIDREMTQATVTFKPTKGVENYTLEVSPSELNDNVVEGAAAGTKVINISSKEVNKEGKIEYTITGLKKDTRYWLRVRSNASGKTASKWTYYEDSSKHRYFKTKAEQIFSTFTHYGKKTCNPKCLKEDEVILKWKADEGSETAAVTHLVLTVAKNAPTTITLDATDIAARSKTLKYADYGIGTSTTFNVIIYNGDDKRGEFTLTSPKARPAGLHELNEDAGETIQDLIQNGSGDIIIGIPASNADIANDEESTRDDQIDVPAIQIPQGVTSVTIYGLAGGVSRRLNFTGSITFATNLTKLRFENVYLNSANGKSIIDQTGVEGHFTIDAVEFDDVYSPTLSKAAYVRLRNTPSGCTIKKLYLNHVWINNQSGIQFIYTKDADNHINEIEITNSTFTNMNHSFIDVSEKATCNSIKISDVTFYNIIGSGRYFINAKLMEPAPTVECYRSIFAKGNASAVRGIQSTVESNEAAYNFSTCYMTSDFKLEEKEGKLVFPFFVGTSVPSSSKIFKDTKERRFTVIDATIEGGDPRWIEPTDD